ncbi:MAG: TaqI-like C-terminal specificity domain-containing protein [Bacteroidota bacterium]
MYDYLSKNKSLLIEKSVEKKQGIRDWYVLFRSRYEELFNKPKIIFRQTGDRIIAAKDNEVGYYCIDSVNVGQLKSKYHHLLDYLIGILNSRLIVFYYQEISQEKNRVLAQVKPQRIRSLPIRIGTDSEIESLYGLVKNINSLKKNNLKANTKPLEDQMDIMVYKLYNLTYKEVEIIDPQIGSIISKENYEKFQLQ